MVIGVIILIIGVLLFPLGIVMFKETWQSYKELSPDKKKIVLLLDVLDIFTSPVLSTWLIFTSFVCILGGSLIILLN